MSHKEAQEQIARLSGLRFFAALSVEAVRELVGALETAAPSFETGRRIVDLILEESTDAPTPYDIRQTAYRVRHLELDRPAGKPDCSDCGGTGFTSRQIRGYDVADPCPCRSGVSLTTTQAPPARPSPVSARLRGILDGGAA